MWIPTDFRTIQKTVRDVMGMTAQLTGIVVDGISMTNSIRHVEWGWDPMQLFVCETCLEPGCSSGNWASLRQAGDYALFLPAFFKDEVDQDSDHESAAWIVAKGAMLLDRKRYAVLRCLAPDLPVLSELQPLAGWQAIRLLRFEAPSDVLGKQWAPVRLERSLLLATDWASDDEAVAALEGLLAAGLASDSPVRLAPLAGALRPVTFFLDQARGYLEWQPLAMGAGPAKLLLAPGYVVEGLT